ncbi:MAG: putative thioredoxin [Rhodospirillaceae bacterium]|nr:MAG: putative thioredoxin [Rhodospirillaceae bacterium]
MGIMDFIRKGGAAKGHKPTGEKGPDDLVKACDTVGFMADVIEASRRVPVIVDLWAPWCGPCRTLGPMLEKLVRQFGGTVRMVKVNVDENQKLAAQLGVSSIPAVFAFKNGALVDGFVGALPESQIKAFLTRVASGGASVIDQILADAKAVREHNDFKKAKELYQKVLEQDPANPVALAGVMECLIAQGETGAAREMLNQLPADLCAKPEILAIKTRLELASTAATGQSISALQQAVDTDPMNHQARQDLAMACYAAGNSQKAVDELLEIVRRDRSWNDDGGRRQLLKLFEAFGPSDPLTVHSRRKLSSIMFS